MQRRPCAAADDTPKQGRLTRDARCLQVVDPSNLTYCPSGRFITEVSAPVVQFHGALNMAKKAAAPAGTPTARKRPARKRSAPRMATAEPASSKGAAAMPS